jgi:predicted exporter
MNHPSLSHPGRWLWLLLLVPVILGVARLRFDVEVFDLLPEDLEVVQGLKLYQDHFANARQLIITVKGLDAEQTSAAAKAIAEALRKQTSLVAHATWEPPWEEDPLQASELMAYLWFNQPAQVFGQLTNRLARAAVSSTLASAREDLATSLSPEDIARLSYDPLGLTRLPETVSGAAPSMGQGQELFSSPDGRFRIVFIESGRELRTYRDCARWLQAVRSVAQEALSGAGLVGPAQAAYTGRPAFVAEVASSMEYDMTVSVIGTAAIIAILFWIAHKRVKPMLWLLALLAVILGCTLALGGLIFGTINVVSMGFAAILLGLAVDYAVVHYQEALAHPDLSIAQVRHAIAPSIFWAAVTTITAFLMLNLGGLPGLGQLGTLVGLGVGLSATIMIFEFLPPLFPDRAEPRPAAAAAAAQHLLPQASPRTRAVVYGATAATLLVCALTLALAGLPPIDPTADALRPRHSPAYAAVDEIQARLNQKREPLWLLVAGTTVSEVANRLAQVQSVLEGAVRDRRLAGFTLATPLWPQPEFQRDNRPIAAQLASLGDAIRQAATAAGFAGNSLAFTEAMLTTWNRASTSEGVYWPTNRMSQWIFDKLVARSSTNFLALGLLNPARTSHGTSPDLSSLTAQWPRNDVWLSGWELLGHAIFFRVESNLWRVVAPMVLLVLLSLWLAFRRRREILLSLTGLVLSGLCLLAVMRGAHWSWNLLNLMAIPLILGTGVDYSIFMQLALRRYDGDLRMAHFAVGRALLLCGGTAIAGFGSLALSSNAGMASLGRVCALGIAANMLIAILLLPTWWQTIRNATRSRAADRG